MERKHSIDLLRIISCLAVIAIHTVSGPLANYSGNLDTSLMSTLDKVHVLMNWSIPVFFMITGYCILGKQEYTYKHCFKHVRKFLIVLATVGLLFALLEEVFIYDTINFSVILRSLQNVASGNLWDHMWYLYDIIGIYLVLPVIHTFMSSNRSNRLIFTGLLFIFTILLPSFAQSIAIGIDFPFGGYLFYVCFGGMVSKEDLRKKQSFFIVLSSFFAALFVVFCPAEYDFGYRSLTICFIALGIFVFFCALQMKAHAFIVTISQCTFGMYLIHPLFINVAVKLFKIDFLSYMPYAKLTALYVTICLVSFLTIFIFRKLFSYSSLLRFTHNRQEP